VACYNESMRASADRHGATVVDMWGMAALSDPRTWARDRLHLTAEGHRRVALRVLETIGEPAPEDWRAPLPIAEPTPWRSRQAEDLRWMRDFVAPFVRQRLQGHRTGDGFVAKHSELLPFQRGSTPAV
jgi:hypothetical protein